MKAKTEKEKGKGITRLQYIGIVCGLVGVFVILFLIMIMAKVPSNKVRVFLVLAWLVEGLLSAWILFSFRFVAYAERAFAIILGGDPIYIEGAKIVFVPRFPYTQFVKYPKKTFDFHDLPGNGFTRAGTFRDTYYEPEPVKVKGFGYIRIPAGLDGLTKFHWAEIPKDDDGLENWLQEFADRLFWDLMPKFICREFFEAYSEEDKDKDLMKKVQVEIDKMIEEACEEGNVLGIVGFTANDIGIGIRDLEWREELVEKMSRVNVEEYETKAAKKESQQRVHESMGVYIDNMTLAEGGDIEEPDGKYKIKDPKEAKELSKEFTEQQMALKANSMQRIDINSGDNNLMGLIAGVVAAAKQIGDSSDVGEKGDQEKKKKKKKPKKALSDMSEEEYFASLADEDEEEEENE
ncbi:MAG: hypothetical protein HQ539_02305 [Parcubacteria group bacterium]|nr:hypothetical protein [Parcubacteria group bacterium]